MEVAEPQSAIVEDGQWLIFAVTKMWLDRKGRRGVVDPSGGLTAAPAFDSEVLLAFPLVDNPTSANPKGTITVPEFQKRIIGPLVNLNEKIVSVDTSDF
jgi:hypothetical protein